MENQPTQEPEFDISYTHYPSLSGGIRVTLKDLREIKFEKPLQKQFDSWYETQLANGLVDASYSFRGATRAEFNQSVKEFLDAEQAIEENRIKEPPTPTEDTPEFISNILGASKLSF